MGYFIDAAQMTVSGTPGTGAITLLAAVPGYQTFAAAGIVDGQLVSYAIQDTGANWEYGRGTYTASGTSLARTTIIGSSNGNAAISCTNAAIVGATLLAEDVVTTAWNYPGGLINKFRNGTMDMFSRGTAAITITTAGAYSADGWIVVPTGASCTAAQAGGRSLTVNALKVTGAASVTDIIVKQRIESYIAAVMTSQTVTVQAQIQNNTGSTLTPTLTVKHPTAADNYGATGTDVSAVSLQSCANGVWQQVSYTFTASASSAFGMEVAFDFGNNFSTNGKNLLITECDIRVTPNTATGLNSFPPSPELRPISIETDLNQRYYQNSFQPGTTPAQNVGIGTGESIYIATVVGINPERSGTIFFQVEMRAAPSITTYSTSANSSQVYDQNAPGACTSTGIANNGVSGFRITATGNASTGVGFLLGFHWAASAEL